MDTMRLIPRRNLPAAGPCCRCGEMVKRWDRIAGQPCCPNCQEELVLGVAEPWCAPTEPHHCAVCSQAGTVRYLTFPVGTNVPVEMDLCPEHLRALLGRCLKPRAFLRLRRQLQTVGLDVEQLFLLHDAFYDAEGVALQPALEAE